MLRVSFIIDGFNFYHSAKNAQTDLGGRSTKWLDFRSLFQSLLYSARQSLGVKERLEIADIFYFTALARHLESCNPGITARHRSYIDCLEDTGINIEHARFKPKNIKCPCCYKSFTRYEEKETDVAVGVKLLELLALNQCDIGIILTGDTDICPAITCAKKLFPGKSVGVAFPYQRKNKELKKVADFTLKISKENYAAHQFSNSYKKRDGSFISKPISW